MPIATVNSREGRTVPKQDELMKPLQNKVFNAIQDVAKKDLDFVFDRGACIAFIRKREIRYYADVMDKLQLQ